MPTDSGLRSVLSRSLSICRTLNLREKSVIVPRFRINKTAGRVASPRALTGMPTDSGLRSVLSRSLSICRTLNLREKSVIVPRFRINKTAGRGQEDLIGRKISPAAGRPDPQLETCSPVSFCRGRNLFWGRAPPRKQLLFRSPALRRNPSNPPPEGGTTNSKNGRFFPARATFAFVGGAESFLSEAQSERRASTGLRREARMAG